MDTNKLQEKINDLSQEKIKKGEYIASTLGQSGTGLGVYLVKGDWAKHNSAERSYRNLSHIFEHLISPEEVINQTLRTVMDLSDRKCSVAFVKNEWDNNENRILEIMIDEHYSTAEINEFVNSMKTNQRAQNYIT